LNSSCIVVVGVVNFASVVSNCIVDFGSVHIVVIVDIVSPSGVYNSNLSHVLTSSDSLVVQYS
jgi:hypothetical protein